MLCVLRYSKVIIFALLTIPFVEIFMVEETLLNMMLNPESSETAGDLIRKIE